MTPKKKLIEVALPLEAINAACKVDKDRKAGTTRSIHKWFARMPLPALRAMIFAALVDAPADEGERERLLRIVERLVQSGPESPSEQVLNEAKQEIKRSMGDDLPTVVDPFCGGGSTLVEAQRLGLLAHGSDLNPIPVLITKVLTEIPPRVKSHPMLHPKPGTLNTEPAQKKNAFVTDVRHYAEAIKADAYEKLSNHYPLGPNGETVIAWWWARTVESPDPRYQGVHTPLVTNWWLSKEKGNRAWVKASPNLEDGSVTYTVQSEGEPGPGTKNRCIFSDTPISFKYIREQGKENLGKHLLAVVTQGKEGRRYFSPDEHHVLAAESAQPESPPTVDLPDAALGFRVQRYGMTEWADLFSSRQMLALEVFAELIAGIPDKVEADGGDREYGNAIATVLGLCLGKLSQSSSALVRWFIREPKSGGSGAGGVLAAFGTQTVSMSWDYVEANPFGGSVGDWMQVVQTALRAFDHVASDQAPTSVFQGDARTAASKFGSDALVVTDPPYFSAIGYADLSDYFYIWIRKALRNVHPELFATISTPKAAELIAAPHRHNTPDDAKNYFIDGFTEAFSSLKEASRVDLPILVVYAYKEQESAREGRISTGWEAMLAAMIRAGLAVVGTWPIWGTGSARMRGNASNALATYVVLVCRQRQVDAQRITRRELGTELRSALEEAVPVLQATAIAPVDLSQAVIGPGMAVFSKYASVLEPDGSVMSVRDALLLINRVLAEVIDEQEGDLDADTRWAVTWFEQHGFGTGRFGDADTLARAKVTSVDGLVRAGIVQQQQGKVRLLRREELTSDYNPAADDRPTGWEAVQHLARRLRSSGEVETGQFLGQLGPLADTAQLLAYRLHQACMNQAWNEEALVYNELISSWPEISRLSRDYESKTLF